MNGNGWGSKPPALHAVEEPKPNPRAIVEVSESDYTTILLGYRIGTAELEDDGKMTVIASGNTLEFQISRPNRKSRTYRANINQLANTALALFEAEVV